MKSTRRIALLLSVVMIVSLIAGCAKTAKSAKLKVDGKTLDGITVMTIDGEDISLDLYRYYYKMLQTTRDQGDDSYWDDNPDALADLKDEVLDNTKSIIAAKRLAAENGVELTQDDQASVDSQVDATIEQFGGFSAYIDALEGEYLTEEVYRQVIEYQMLVNALYNKLYGKGGTYELSDSEMKEIAANEYMRAKNILITSATEDAEELAAQVQEKAASGEDFDALIEEYNEDPGMSSSPDGYYFTDGEMVPEFEQAVKALDENGGISDVVETSYGYHIIQRLPLDMDYVEANLSTLLSSYQQARFNQLITEKMDELQVSFGEYYDQISVDTLQ